MVLLNFRWWQRKYSGSEREKESGGPNTGTGMAPESGAVNIDRSIESTLVAYQKQQLHIRATVTIFGKKKRDWK